MVFVILIHAAGREIKLVGPNKQLLLFKVLFNLI